MPIFKIVGYMVAVLGLLCGVLLLLSPLNAIAAHGMELAAKSVPLGVLFVLLSGLGIVLAGFGSGGKNAVDRMAYQIGSAWLVLGVLAILMLVLDLIGLISAGITVIWWVMATACVVVGSIAVMTGSKT
jgi:Na+-driven multidrug efflux pump